MAAGGAPGRSRASERLIHKILRHVLIAHADKHSAQAIIRGSAVELREVQPLGPRLPNAQPHAADYLARAPVG
jgi:hypothetical protein